ncbi:non-ribosomal peptide synthetase [Chitinophaga sp. Cy-1792]|uniref:non-ribosomal peptide synthetase n=1 Tax=Chitinophaga sp. Cy-1792 TaxID=2608339 RepID=UPI0019666FDA|nr:non-ribosomal peptide synthetase [Chitinophaga sp. Cy-1792]
MKVYNEYGPTETTVGCIVTELHPDKPVIIGKPISGTSIYILDAMQQLVPVGVTGEIYIAGAGVANGYLHQPELTAKKFVAAPFGNGLAYRTGDLARWLPDGNIVFIGRKDDQVKIRGYRIELGEIETAVLGTPGVETAVVLARSGNEGEKELAAYITGKELHVTDIRNYLSGMLPAYMIPAHFVVLDELPLTTNGKVDRKRLPDPAGVNTYASVTYVAPRTDAQIHLAAVLEEVLKKKQVGLRDDFFLLGGDSIKSIQVVSRLKQRGYSLKIQDVLLTPVVEQLSEKMELVTRYASQATVSGLVGLTPIQQYFLEQDTAYAGHYNQSVLLFSATSVALASLQAALDHLWLHHDALRMVYRHEVGSWIQENKGADTAAVLEVLDYAHESAFAAACDRIQSSFRLSEGPLFKAALFRGADGDRLLLAAHHLVVDGVSWRILLDDLSQLYSQHSSGIPLQLPQKTDAYAWWSGQLQAYAQSEALAAAAPYWEQISTASVPPLPLDHAQGSNQARDAVSQSFLLDSTSTTQLLTRCYSAYRTEVNDVLLSALGLALRETFGLPQALVTLEGHGREDIGGGVDVTRTVGWFTTLFPVLLDLEQPDAISQLIAVKEHLHRVPDKGIGYGVLRYLGGKKDELQPQIAFNYLGDFGTGAGNDEAPQFSFIGDYHGLEVAPERLRSTVLNVSGMVVAGQLRMTIGYSKAQFEEATVRRLLSALEQQLQQLITTLAAINQTYPTPVDLSFKGLSLAEVVALNKDGDLEDVYPLSPLQEGLYYHWLSDPAAPFYFEQMNYRLQGPLDISALKESYLQLTARHAVLRTHFMQRPDARVLQVVRKNVPPVFEYITNNEADAAVYRDADRSRGFDLHTGSQMRLTIVALGNDTYDFIWSHHHILMDGWCVGILIREFFQIYYSLVEHNTLQLPPVHPYSDYIRWLTGSAQGSSLAYWKEYLSGYETLSSVPGHTDREPGRYEGRKKQLAITGTLRQQISQYCGRHGITENTFFQVMWGILLGRYNNTADVVFGSIVSGRPAEVKGIEEMIGLFINTIPVRIRMNTDVTVEALLKTVQQEAIEGVSHHQVQLAEIQQESGPGRKLFDHVIIFENYPVKELVAAEMKTGALELLSSDVFEQTSYDLSIVIVPGETVRITFDYNRYCYDDQLIGQLQQHLLQLIEAAMTDTRTTVHQLDYLGTAEKQLQLHAFNTVSPERLPEKTVLQLFEEQVKLSPGNTALYFDGATLTYKELNDYANQLAHCLQRQHHIGANDLVGIHLERSEWTIVAIWGILKAGGAYVPVDPDYPQERITHMLTDSACKTLVDAAFLQQFKATQDQYSKEPVLTAPLPGQLAYVIYTSGSTGRSKGVQITHRNLLHSTVQRQRTYENVLSFLLLSSYAFDSSVAGIFGTLCEGGCLNMVKGSDVADTGALADFICTQQVSHLLTVPSYYQQLLIKLAGRHHALRQVIVAGETCTAQLVDLHFATEGMAHCDLFNEYGPTECAVWSSYHQYEKGKALNTIGKPIANTRIYLLDDHLQLLPVGTTGEICIGGDGLSPGYLNRPELTMEKFVEDPFCKGERMYRTGDLARWLPDGNIEFIGRKDDQVKIRGYRIELGEIEKVLQICTGVDAAVVITHSRINGEKELVAYVTGSEPLEATLLRTEMAVHLPPYMLPARFVQLDTFPLTPNGKVDRKHMPDPDGIAMDSGVGYVAPRNSTEARLADIWQEILGVAQVGMLDDFFLLGGHSLKVTRLAGMIHQQFEVKLGIAQLFTVTVLEAQAQLITGARRKVFANIQSLPEQLHYALSAAQRRLWALSQSEEGNIGYNMPGVYRLTGALDVTAWQQALQRLTARHEILRTVFKEAENGEIRQFILPAEAMTPTFIYEDLRGVVQQEDVLQAAIRKEAMQPFDLANGPLIRVSLYRIQDHEWVFSYVLHHIISDGWSMQVLSDELLQLYYHAAPLPPLRFHYKDYAAWQQLKGQEAADQQYWLQQFEEEVPVLALAGDKPRPPVKTYNGAAVNKRLSATLTRALKKIAAEEGSTLFMGLLAGVNALLHRYTHQEDIVIGSPVAGRDHIDLEKQIGFYINTLPLRTRFKGTESFRQLLRHIREVTLSAYEHQHYPFDALVDALQLRRDVSRNPLFDVWVVLQNQDANAHHEGPLTVSGYEAAENLICRFDLLFNFVETGEEIHVGLLYNTDIYQESTAQQLTSHLEQLLEAAVTAADKELVHLDFLTTAEKQSHLSSGGQAVAGHWTGETVTTLFEAQAAATPDHTALVFDVRRLTYRELNETANRMAAHLRTTCDLRPDDLVAIRLERSEWLIVAMIAVMKAGAAYVPIDPEYPAERVDYMMTDSRCKACIDDNWLQTFLEHAPDYDGANLPAISGAQHLAYVIYTSGSTGHPKGVMITHAAIVDYTAGIITRTNIRDCRRFGLVSTIAADLGNTVIYPALLTGGELHLFTAAAVMNPEVMQHAELDCVKIVPSHWKALQGAHHAFIPLKCLIFGGEQLTMDVIRLLQSAGATCQVYNHYGPSETTVGKLARQINIHDQHLAISLGIPFGNNYVYLLDDYQQLVPSGAAGEICIGGEGLAMGYLHRPDATAEKFVNDPFRDNARIYRTGDLGRRLHDGSIAFIGRKDDQVKIRGFRIEPGEITNVLLRQSHITSAIVMAVDGASAEKQLVAWFSAGSEFDLADLRNSLQTSLPAYMMPAHFVRMDMLPLTANGKIDRRALPLPDAQSATSATAYVAPRTEVEEQLVAIWSEVLEAGKDKIGIKDSFFDLGGHSLKAIRIVLRIHEQFNVEIDLTNFFLEPNIEALAEEIENIRWMQQ